MALVRQDLQTKVTDAFARLNTRAPIARKETVGKKAFFIWWNTFMKNSTWPFKLSIDESKCQSYSANYSSVCSSRCLNPLLSILLSYPSVWLSGPLSCRLFFSPNSNSFVQNQFIIYVLVLFPTVRWIQMTPSTVCFGARDDSYGFFRTSKAGNIITFKLTYRSGYVTCDARKSSFHSKWGCLWNRFIPNQMATLITDKNRNLLLPKSDFLSDYRDCKFYSLPWATTESPQLLFDNFSTPLTVETNQEFQIWYSEDLFKWGYGDNGYEKTCVAVYGLYVWVVAKIRKYVEEESAKNCCSCLYHFNIT